METRIEIGNFNEWSDGAQDWPFQKTIRDICAEGWVIVTITEIQGAPQKTHVVVLKRSEK